MLFPLSGNRRHPQHCQHTEIGTKLYAQSDASGRQWKIAHGLKLGWSKCPRESSGMQRSNYSTAFSEVIAVGNLRHAREHTDKSTARSIDLGGKTMVAKETLRSSLKMWSTNIQKTGIYIMRLPKIVAEDPIYAQFYLAQAFAFSMFSVRERSKSTTFHP